MGVVSITGGIGVVGVYTWWENSNRKRSSAAQDTDDSHEMVPLSPKAGDGDGTYT
jgi:hypothetical protein